MHWHLYILPNKTYVETASMSFLTGDCFVFDDYPAQGFGFQVKSHKEISRIASNVAKLIEHIADLEIGHNVLVTRGSGFKDASKSVIRVFVGARRKTPFPLIGFIKRVYGTGVAELSGAVVVYDEARFDDIDEEEIIAALRHECHEEFQRIRKDILNTSLLN